MTQTGRAMRQRLPWQAVQFLLNGARALDVSAAPDVYPHRPPVLAPEQKIGRPGTSPMYKQRYPAGFLMRRFFFVPSRFSDSGRATLRHFPFS